MLPDIDDDDPDTDDSGLEPFDKDAIRHDIATGAKAYRELRNSADMDWTRWSAVVRGQRGLRTLAFAKAGTTSMKSQAYRDAMSALLQQRQYAIYDQIDKQTRSACYALMDRLEDIDNWYAGLPVEQKLQWKHPKTIVKHCPRQYLAGMRKHNLPPRKMKKPAVSFETERLKALLIQVIKRLMKYEPDAADLLDQVHPAEPDDSIDDVFAAADDDEQAAS